MEGGGRGDGYRCDSCNKTFSRRFNLERHRKKVCYGQMGGYTCEHCGKRFTREQRLGAHNRFCRSFEAMGTPRAPVAPGPSNVGRPRQRGGRRPGVRGRMPADLDLFRDTLRAAPVVEGDAPLSNLIANYWTSIQSRLKCQKTMDTLNVRLWSPQDVVGVGVDREDLWRKLETL